MDPSLWAAGRCCGVELSEGHDVLYLGSIVFTKKNILSENRLSGEYWAVRLGLSISWRMHWEQGLTSFPVRAFKRYRAVGEWQ